MDIVPVIPADFDDCLVLNESCVPHVNSITWEDMDHFLTSTRHFVKVVGEGGDLAGYVVALPPGITYGSVNYRWFSERYEEFLYIDRIMTHPNYRRLGVANRLYDYLGRVARKDGLQRLCCEVNIDPPNPGSHALHHEMGFRSAGQQTTDAGKTVDLLVKELVS